MCLCSPGSNLCSCGMCSRIRSSRHALGCMDIAEGVFFFFLRLPNGQYGPVSQLSRSEKCCTGPFNWGEAHCAGEKVKRKIGQFQRKSL